jgi:hypothetical protein
VLVMWQKSRKVVGREGCDGSGRSSLEGTGTRPIAWWCHSEPLHSQHES